MRASVAADPRRSRWSLGEALYTLIMRKGPLFLATAAAAAVGLGILLWPRPPTVVVKGFLSNSDQGIVQDLITREIRRPGKRGLSWKKVKDVPRLLGLLATSRVAEIEVIPVPWYSVQVKTKSCAGPYFYYVQKGANGLHVSSEGIVPHFAVVGVPASRTYKVYSFSHSAVNQFFPPPPTTAHGPTVTNKTGE